MKLQHFAMSCLFLLIAAGLYLTLKSDMEESQKEQRMVNEKLVEGMTRLAGKMEDAKAAPAAPAAVQAPASPAPAPAAATPPVVAATPPPAVAPVPAATDASIPPANAAAPAAAGDPAVEAALASDAAALVASSREQLEVPAPGASAEGDAGRPLTRLQDAITRQGAIAKIKDAQTGTDFVVINAGKNSNISAGDTFAVRRGTAIVGRVVVNDNILNDEAVADVKRLVAGMVLQNGDELIIFDDQQ